MNLTNHDWRAVAEDSMREVGRWSPGDWLWRMGVVNASANAYAEASASANAYAEASASAYADADANAYADADADASASAYADADANAYADADANADASANAYAEASASAYAIQELFPSTPGEHVDPGLYMYSLPSGSTVVLRVGWIRRSKSGGDEYHGLNTVTPYRDGYSVRLTTVASKGPSAAKNWEWSEPLELPLPLNRFHIVPIARLKPEQWEKVCPKPKDWVEE